MSEAGPRRKFYADEIFLIGVVLAAFVGAELFTWGSVSQDLAFRGVFFLGVVGVGLGAYGASGTAGFKKLFLPRPNWKDLAIVGVASVVGIAATRILQAVILQLAGGSVFLEALPPDMQRVYLAEAALAETCFVFGLFALLCRIHWVVGVVLMTVISGFLHAYNYGLMPGAIPAVAASFALQLILVVATHRPSCMVLVHLGWNLL